MSESVMGYLEFNQIGKFSYTSNDTRVNVEGQHISYWAWDLYGHSKRSDMRIGKREVDTTIFFKFRSDIRADLLEKIYSKSSQQFKKDHIQIIKSVPWIDGSEFDLIELIFSGLKKHEYYNIDMITSIVRDRRIDSVLSTQS